MCFCLFHPCKSLRGSREIASVFIDRVQHNSSTSTTLLLGKRTRCLERLPVGWYITEWWGKHYEEELLLLPFSMNEHREQCRGGAGEMLHWGEKRNQDTVVDFSMASLSLLLNNKMKISLWHPTTLVQSIRHQHALQATFNSLKMELTFLFYSLRNSRCLWGREHENSSKTQRA